MYTTAGFTSQLRDKSEALKHRWESTTRKEGPCLCLEIFFRQFDDNSAKTWLGWVTECIFYCVLVVSPKKVCNISRRIQTSSTRHILDRQPKAQRRPWCCISNNLVASMVSCFLVLGHVDRGEDKSAINHSFIHTQTLRECTHAMQAYTFRSRPSSLETAA